MHHDLGGTNDKTIQLLKDNNYFGLQPSQVTIVQQGMGVLALMDNEARIAVWSDTCMLLHFICRVVYRFILKRTDTIRRERREERHYNPASTAVAADDTTINRVSELIVSERQSVLGGSAGHEY